VGNSGGNGCSNRVGDSKGCAMSLLVNLETARQERSMLLSEEPKSTGEGRKRSLAKKTKLDFMSFKTNSYKARMHVFLTWISKEKCMDPDKSVCLILVS
jgi:hypothetical protein